MNGMNFVQIIAYGKTFYFLIDTGASVSAIKKSSIQNGMKVSKNEKIKINGIGGSVSSCGSVEMKFRMNDVWLEQAFVVIEDFINEADGIIGTDFLARYSAIIDFEKLTLSIWHKKSKIVVPLNSNKSINCC